MPDNRPMLHPSPGPGGAGTMARLLRLLGLSLGLWAALWLAAALFLGAALWIVALALLLLVVHALVMALEFGLMRRASRGDAAPVPARGELLRAWWHEVLGALWVFGWLQPWRSRRHADRAGDGAAGRRGVILVHGFLCNRGIWNPWLQRLHALGVPCIALDLEPVFGDIGAYVPQIDAAVQRMQQATGLPPLLVAHSMGGLAVRAWLSHTDGGDERIHRVVTIGTPHRGTWLARFGLAANTRQMRLDSTWVRSLAAGEPPERARRFTCFYGHCDNIVFPPAAATLPGADNRHLRATAHVHMLRHPAVLDEVLRLLGAGVGPQPAANSRSPGSTTPASISGMPRTSA
jgi:triacylglycerol lipase